MSREFAVFVKTSSGAKGAVKSASRESAFEECLAMQLQQPAHDIWVSYFDLSVDAASQQRLNPA